MRKTRRYNQKSKKDFRGLANSAPRLRQSSNQVRPAFGPLATKALAGRMSGRDSNEQRSRSGCSEVPRPHCPTTPATSQFFFGNGAFTFFQQQTPPTYNSLLQFNVSTSPAMLNDFLIDPPSLNSAVQTVGSALNANNPDLTAFKSHGGKLVQYHGWADPLVA